MTVSPRWAASTAASIISFCAPSALPGNFFAMRTCTVCGMRARTAAGTSLSESTRSASWVRAVCVASVSRDGWPGPEPTSSMRPFWRTSSPWTEGGGRAERSVGDVECSPARTSRISCSLIAASRESGQYSLTCATHFIRRLACSASVSVGLRGGTGRFGVATPLSSLSHPSSSSSSASVRARERMVPTLSTAAPTSFESRLTISRLTRLPKRHPCPFVVTPTCRAVRAPDTASSNRCAAANEKSHRSGASVVFTGIFRALQRR